MDIWIFSHRAAKKNLTFWGGWTISRNWMHCTVNAGLIFQDSYPEKASSSKRVTNMEVSESE